MSSRVLRPASVLAASAALLAGGVIASAPAASAAATITAAPIDEPPPQTFHCSVLVDADVLIFHVTLHQHAVVVATTAVEAENAAVEKVNAALPLSETAVSAQCIAIA